MINKILFHCVCVCVYVSVPMQFCFVLEKNCRRNVDEEDPTGSELSSLLNDQNDVENENWNEGVQSFMIFYRNNFHFKSLIRRKTVSNQSMNYPTIHFILK